MAAPENRKARRSVQRVEGNGSIECRLATVGKGVLRMLSAGVAEIGKRGLGVGMWEVI